MAPITSEPLTTQLRVKVRDGRVFYRQGMSLLEAAVSAGVHSDTLAHYITTADDAAHDACSNWRRVDGVTYSDQALAAADRLIATHLPSSPPDAVLRHMLAAAWLEGSIAGSAETRDLYTGPLVAVAGELRPGRVTA